LNWSTNLTTFLHQEDPTFLDLGSLPFFYIKRATQAGLPRRLRHPPKMIVRLRFGGSGWAFAASMSPKKMVIGLRSGNRGFALGRRCIVQSEWDTLPGSCAEKLHAASTLPDKDADSDHARFLDWATADHTTELMPSSPLPSPVVAFHFPAPFSPPTSFFS
jgi:hypothetical protein